MRTTHTQVSGNKSTRQMLHHPGFLQSADTYKDKPKKTGRQAALKFIFIPRDF